MKRLLVLLLSAALIASAHGQSINGGGGGSGSGSGTVTSIATACAVSGGTITTTGTIRGAAAEDIVAGTSYPVVDGDCGRVKRFTNAALVTVTLVSPTGFTNASTWFTTLKADGAAGLSVTPSGSTLDGGAGAITVAQGKSLDVYSDGTNWHSLPGNSTSTGGTNTALGLAQGDGITVDMTAGVVSTKSIDHPGYRANVYYALFPYIPNGAGSGAPTAATAYCSIGRIGGATKATISSLIFRVTVAGTSNAQLAIYNSDFTSGINRPGTLIANTGNISINGVTGTLAGTFTGVQINPGWYWFCVQVNDTTVRYQTAQSSTNTMAEAIYVGSATLSNFLNPAPLGGVSTTTGVSAFGTWPSFVGATFNETTSLAPQAGVLFSSVP